MKDRIQILYLEDDVLDEELIRTMILNDCPKCNVISVSTKKDFTFNLKTFPIDLILADYDLPDFSGLAALKITRRIYPNIPFIFVTGRISEDMAIEAIKAGATDYVFKDKLGKLIPSLKRALKEVSELKSIKEIEKKLIVSNELFKFIIEGSTDGITIINQKGVIISWNRSMEIITGIRQNEALNRYIWDIQYQFAPGELKNEIFYNDVKEKIKEALSSGKAKWINKTLEIKIVDISNNYKYIECVSLLIRTEDEIFVVTMMRDITDKKKAEETLLIKDYALESSSSGILLTDLKLKITYANKAAIDILGTEDVNGLVGKSALRFSLFGNEAENIVSIIFNKGKWEGEFCIKKLDKHIINLHVFASLVKDKTGKPICIMANFYDITINKKTEKELLDNEAKYKGLFQYSNDAIFINDFDGNIIDVNEKACILVGFNKEKLLKVKISDLYPDTELVNGNDAFHKVITEGAVRFNSVLKKFDSSLVDVDISASIIDKDKKIIQYIIRYLEQKKLILKKKLVEIN